MGKRVIDPKVRSILMQGLLVVVFACAVGLAALVTRQVRRSMRVELGEQRTVGRIVLRLPSKWLSSPVQVEKGEGIEAEEPPSEEQAGRRLRVLRQRTDGLVSPLEHLVRSGRIKAEVLKSLAEGREGFSLTNVPIGGWPGQMVTMLASPRAGVVHKDVVGCATLPGGQALVVEVQGLGPLDASDRELVRQMGENVSLAGLGAAPETSGGATVELVDQIRVDVPSRFVAVENADVNRLGRELLFDGSRGSGWACVELVSCVFFEDDREETFAAMLAGRDPDWHGGPIKRLGPRTLMAERTDALGQAFPQRAYLTASSDGRALLVVMRGGPRDGARLFDPAWEAIASSVRFAGSKDLSALLVNGAEAARRVPETLANLGDGPGAADWWMWDASENADKELWAQYKWQWSKKPGEGADAAAEGATLSGVRTSRPVAAYASADAQFEQQWSISADGQKYQAVTTRDVRRAGSGFASRRPEQRVTVEAGRLTLAAGNGGMSTADAALPAQFVPGAVLPLVLRDLAERPVLLRTESFVGTETLAPPGLLTLFVTRLTDAPVRLDERGEPMDCVSVSVNGTGAVSRWYYTAAGGELRFIDFAGGLKAASGQEGGK